MAKRQSTMLMFFKKADRTSATEYAVVKRNFFTSDGISANDEDVLDQWFLTFLAEQNPNETFRSSRNPSAIIYLSCTHQVVNEMNSLRSGRVFGRHTKLIFHRQQLRSLLVFDGCQS